MTDMTKARHFMVECQVRPSDVTDTRITEVMSRLERERFVPAVRQALAYSDACIEVKPGRFLMDPRSLAKLVQALDIRELGEGFFTRVFPPISAINSSSASLQSGRTNRPPSRGTH